VSAGDLYVVEISIVTLACPSNVTRGAKSTVKGRIMYSKQGFKLDSNM
jgi:hypothetical protein